MFSVELALFKERFLLKSFLTYVGIYPLVLVFQFFTGNEGAPQLFFPALAVLFGSSFWLVFLNDGKTDSYRRLLPSLPFGRSEIYLSHFALRFLLWIIGCLISYAISFFASLFLDIQLDLSHVLYGISLSFGIFSLSNLSLQFKPMISIAYLGALTGLSLGLLLSANNLLMQELQNIHLWGPTLLGISFALGLFLTVFNGVLYRWRRP